MKVTYGWLKDFVDITVPAQKLADKLTMAGLEVTSLEAHEEDFVFEIEVTSNRPDWLSVMGIAREVAAITGKKLKQAPSPRLQVSSLRPAACGLRLEIENKKDCPLYTAKIITGVKIGHAPEWMRKRLERVGCRSVNNIVDITNYVLFETGEPLHAFDLDALASGKIIVRRGRQGEVLETIDGVQRILSPQMLLIADEKKPIAIAGIMGGKDTEVTAKTRNILLEAAFFNPVLVRRTRMELGLKSESAYRFERGVNPAAVEPASMRAAALMQELALGSLTEAKKTGSVTFKPRSVSLSTAMANKVLGIVLSASAIKVTLEKLGFKARAKTKDVLSVAIPLHRPDVSVAQDLIEEIARIHGYEAIPATIPASRLAVTPDKTRDLVSFLKNILVGLGLNEAITYSLIDKASVQDFGRDWGEGLLEISNPLSREQEILRPSLMPSLFARLSYNLNQSQEYIALFEIANVFCLKKHRPQETLMLGIALCGTRSFFSQSGLIKEEAGFLHLKGILEALFLKLGIQGYSLCAEEPDGSLSVRINNESIGALRGLADTLSREMDIKTKEVAFLELDLQKIFSLARFEKKFTPLPRYPGISRDISVVLKSDIAIDKVLTLLRAKGAPLLQRVSIADFYSGAQIPAGSRGITLSCFYCSSERTLTDGEIAPLHAQLCTLLTQELGALIR